MTACTQCASMLLIGLLVLVDVLASETWMVIHVAVATINTIEDPCNSCDRS